jgi:hypothetical protein
MVSEDTSPQAEEPQAQPQVTITDTTPEGQDTFNPALPFVLPTEDNVQAPVAPTEEPATETASQEAEQGAENVQATPAVPQQEIGTQPAIETPLPNMPEQQVPAQPTVDHRMKQMEQALRGYETEKAQQQFSQQRQQVQQQYEQQGFDPETSSVLTQQWEANVQQAQQLSFQAQSRENLMASMMTNALRLQKETGADPMELLKYTDPIQMENAARGQSEVNKLKSENKRLKEQLAPAQKFDDNTASPSSEDSQEYWMDRYIQGDTSPKAQAAGRRAAGLL